MAENSANDVVNQAQSMGDLSSIDVSGPTLASNGAGAGEEVQGSGGGDSADAASVDKTTTSLSKYPGRLEYQDVRVEKPLVNGCADASHEQEASNNNGDKLNVSDNINGIDNASFTGSEDASEAGYSRQEGSGDSKVDITEGSWRRERSNSIAKRPTGFKSVSVTKNYLAKSGATMPATLRTGSIDKPSLVMTSSTAQAAKPRLVAKLGKDARSSIISTGGSTAGGPDASKVWNRNRPAPPTLPKQFTDEELKQQYGIHLATRLQADEASKDGKWADIDDDEDDWAPEPVQWMDGTKSNITPDAPPVHPKSDSAVSKPDGAVDSKPASPFQPSSIFPSAGKTILRPSTRTASATQTKPGLVLKSVPESPSPSSRPTSISQKGSPWASLPPVDKASPIAFVPPVIPLSRSPLSRHMDSSAIDDGPALPAKEIAADDFDRSWRESNSGGQALFNSNSGRYEPVKALRRPSRHESNSSRPHAVLQRPSNQPFDVNGTATSNYQSSKTWGRGQGGEGTMDRRGSGTDLNEDPAKPRETYSSDVSQSTPGIGNTSSNPSQTFSASASSSLLADPRTQQQLLMRERLELNRKRKQEEADREEAARKERITQKLAALEAASTPKDMSVNPPQPVVDGKPTASKPPQEVEAASKPDSPTANSKNLTPQEKATSIAPPVAQMSKSQPQSAQSISPAERTLPKSFSDPNVGLSVADGEVQLPGLGQPVQTDRNHHGGWNNRMTHHHNDNQQWNARNIHHNGKNHHVWAPPTTHGPPLGNGAFQRQITSQHILPTPIGSNLPFASPHPTPSPPVAYNENVGRPQIQFATNIEPTRPNQGRPMQAPQGRETNNAMAAWQSFPAHVDEHDDAVDERLMEANNAVFLARIQARKNIGVPAPVDPTKVEIAESFRKVVATGELGFRRKNPMEEAAAAKAEAAKAQAAEHGFVTSQQPQQLGASGSPLHPASNGRSPRFFGPTADRTPTMASNQQYSAFVSSRSQSPPPPETGDHPVYGEQVHATVRLPQPPPVVKMPPGPITSGPHLHGPVQMPPHPDSRTQPITQNSDWQARFNGLFGKPSSPAHKTLISSPTNAVKSLTKPIPPPISSSSKMAYHDVTTTHTATVSLPVKSEVLKKNPIITSLADTLMETKPDEESLMDDREFGSSPTVNLFQGAHPRQIEILSARPDLNYDSTIETMERTNQFVIRTAVEVNMHEGFNASHFEVNINILGKSVTTRTFVRQASAPVPEQAQLEPSPINPFYDATHGSGHTRGRGVFGRGGRGQTRKPYNNSRINRDSQASSSATGASSSKLAAIKTPGAEGDTGKRNISGGAPTGPKSKYQKRGPQPHGPNSQHANPTASATTPTAA